MTYNGRVYDIGDGGKGYYHIYSETELEYARKNGKLD